MEVSFTEMIFIEFNLSIIVEIFFVLELLYDDNRGDDDGDGNDDNVYDRNSDELVVLGMSLLFIVI